MNKIEQLKKLVTDIEPDYQKCFEKGNKSAGVRVRTQMQLIKQLCAEIRTEVQENKKK